MATIPKPVFIYGTLCAKPLLAWALTGDATKTEEISALLRPAKVENIARYALHGLDFPAAIREPGSCTDGYLFQPKTCSQRKKLDDFEGEVYQNETVQARLSSDESGNTASLIEADIYLWNGDKDLVSDKSWDLDWFVRERLEDWIGLFEGMEMVGDDSS
ncbi:Putative gamma-glutamyl cyclotransferase, protein AIG2 [Colletotrichum destructivum]|uniref:Putative gamma-glutamylcyclotransferase n=1 Tax=Colletotrichum destructivum TaxID=34406 RepID=A0AAX4INJ0_9PEZI|nr:Putative gamma-glutamyl cyclotransferase, protein AIG2 [Colletotrichum destructivum]